MDGSGQSWSQQNLHGQPPNKKTIRIDERDYESIAPTSESYDLNYMMRKKHCVTRVNMFRFIDGLDELGLDCGRSV